jgi:hypothetical protein
MLEGRSFIVFTDQKPLTFALTCISEPWIAVVGESNMITDLLSRSVVVSRLVADFRPGFAVCKPVSVKVPTGIPPATAPASLNKSVDRSSSRVKNPVSIYNTPQTAGIYLWRLGLLSYSHREIHESL